MTGRVVKGIGGFYYVYDGSAVYMGKARGNLKRNKSLIYVGDIVDFDIDDNKQCIINKIIERKNSLIRPPVSNLEMLVVVFAAAKPNVNFPVIDKLIAACEVRNIGIAICISKIDLVTDEKLDEYMDTYKGIYPVVGVNGNTGEGVNELFKIISGKNVALAGPSGVGKSTITNWIVGHGTVETGTVSDKTERGRHTTRHVEIFSLTDGTYLYDTPGFTSMEMPDMDEREIAALFPEFRLHVAECKYADCIHINEPECAIKDGLTAGEIKQTRYDSYLMMVDEVRKWHR